MAERPTIIIDAVEYEPESMYAHVPVRVKTQQEYRGVAARKSDGITCLAVRTFGAARSHNIEVSAIRGITIRGRRHEPTVPPARWKLRSQELIRIIEGDFSEEWARPYFDRTSPKWWCNDGSAGTAAEATTPVSYTQAAPPPAKRGWLAKLLGR